MGGSHRDEEVEDLNQSLITVAPSVVQPQEAENHEQNKKLSKRVWIETNKLWKIVGPAIFSRVTGYSMTVITLAFAGHLGENELAAISISNTVIIGFNFGLLVFILILQVILVESNELNFPAHLNLSKFSELNST